MKVLLQQCDDPIECAPLHVYDEQDFPDKFEDDPESNGDGAIVELPSELWERFNKAADDYWTVMGELNEYFNARRHELLNSKPAEETKTE